MPDNVWRKNLAKHKTNKKLKKEELKKKFERIHDIFLNNIKRAEGRETGHTNLIGHEFESFKSDEDIQLYLDQANKIETGEETMKI